MTSQLYNTCRGVLLCLVAAFSCVSAYVLPVARTKGCSKYPSFSSFSYGSSESKLHTSALNMFKHHNAPVHPSNQYGVGDIGLDIAKLIMNALKQSKHPWTVMVFAWWKTVPLVVRSLFTSIYPGDLFLFALFQLSHKRTLRLAHKLQIIAWKMLSMGQVSDGNSNHGS